MPRKIVLSKNYLNSTRGKNSTRLYSDEHREKLRESWRDAPMERRARWNEIVADYNARKRKEINERIGKSCTVCKSFKALEEFPKNIASADGYNTMCIECRREYDRVRYETKGHSIRERVKRYRQLNLPKVNAADAARIKRRKFATPDWLSAIQWAQIEEFYELAAAKTMQTGIDHHVDHIVPIKGKKVSGLNVPWNLQLLTAQKNMRKSAAFIEE